MRRGAKPGKTKVEPKLPVARKSLKSEGSRVRQLQKRLAEALKREAEAQEQQRATSEILRVISSSPMDVQPVCEAIVASAGRLCNGTTASVFLVHDGTLYHPANYGGSPEALAAARARYPRPLGVDTGPGIAILTRSVHEVRDVEDSSTAEHIRAVGRVLGFRSVITVPMLREGEAIGAIAVTRREPGPFSEGDMALLQTFADQAVIAVENVRLFTELQEKNRALTAAHAQVTEALEQQTATAEILRVISGSPTDIQPVFDIIAENAVRLCGAEASTVIRFDGEWVHLVAVYGSSPEGVEAVRRSYPVRGGGASAAARSIRDRAIAHIPDVLVDEEYGPQAAAVGSGFRATLAVPMLREGRAIGAIAIARSGPGEFSERQVELLRTFADQALIAVENVRLFTELQAKTRALTGANAHDTEALGQPTATAEILRVISRSQTDVQPVFDTIVKSAVRLCGGLFSALFRFDGELLHQ